MKDKIEKIKSEIKSNDLSILFFWSPHCPACTEAKKLYKHLKKEYPENKMLDLEFNEETFDFYSNFAEKVQKEEPKLDENEEIVKDQEGIPVLEKVVDDKGNPVMETKVTVPYFVIFSKSQIGKNNPYGVMGRLAGNNPEDLNLILKAINLRINSGSKKNVG